MLTLSFSLFQAFTVEKTPYGEVSFFELYRTGPSVVVLSAALGEAGLPRETEAISPFSVFLNLFLQENRLLVGRYWR